MNVAVLGKSRINSALEERLLFSGFTPLVFEDISRIESIKGGAGCFTIKNDGSSFGSAYILVTEEPSSGSAYGKKDAITIEGLDISGVPYSSIPVVFILDYPVDSSTFMTRAALEKSLGLARRKRKVIYLSRFMRTAGDNLESLYREARSCGVIFFKYDSISMEYSDEKQAFHIKISDKADSLEVYTNIPVIDGESGISAAFSKLVKLLKLKQDSKDKINNDSFFLYPCLTNRKGIYLINCNDSLGSGSELEDRIKFILSDINSQIKAAQGLSCSGYAEVDIEKCAFCYTCFRACPHTAMAPDYENSVMKNLKDSCTGCGICFSVCPANAIKMVEKQDKEQKITKGSIKVFCCENSGEIAFKKIVKDLDEKGIEVSITTVSCGGELSTEIISSALKDFDRVLVAVCLDDACRHFEGNKRASLYVDRVKAMLKASGMDENRVTYMQLSHAMDVVLREYIEDLASFGGVIL